MTPQDAGMWRNTALLCESVAVLAWAEWLLRRQQEDWLAVWMTPAAHLAWRAEVAHQQDHVEYLHRQAVVAREMATKHGVQWDGGLL